MSEDDFNNTGEMISEPRLRRLRRTPAIRRLLAAPLPGPEKFLWPVFVAEGRNVQAEITAMPGQYRWSVDRLAGAVEPVFSAGISGVLVFGVPDAARKSADAVYAAAHDGLVQRAVTELRRQFPGLVIFTDVCLCAYTDTGLCGFRNPAGELDDERTNAMLAAIAVSHAAAGADGVAPSAMMDGQVTAIRHALAASGYGSRLLMSYSTKFASAMYGPFREAAASAPTGGGDRRDCQADPGDLGAALRESMVDANEGADIIMVKPALFYLDVICRLREQTRLPLAAYNVSGEYGMLTAAAQRGWGDLREMVRESTMALQRAGADIIISYWANRYKELLG